MDRLAHEKNRASWNAATVAHNSHKGDQARFFREGGDTLYPEEIGLLGELRGKRLVHLQCNSGQDTLSLARRGAIVTGVDISDEAIAFAQSLSRDAGIPATFVRTDVYDWLAAERESPRRYDIAFCSIGALCWLSDIGEWVRGVAAILAPGGRFVAVEVHPFLFMYDDNMNRVHSYFRDGMPLEWSDGVLDYVAAAHEGREGDDYEPGVVDFKNPHACLEFQWTLGDLLSAVLAAGLRIEHFREYPHSHCNLFNGQVCDDKDQWYFPPGVPSIPQMYSLVAAKD